MRDDIGLVAPLLVSDPDRTRCLPLPIWTFLVHNFLIPLSRTLTPVDLEPDGLWFRYGILISPVSFAFIVSAV